MVETFRKFLSLFITAAAIDARMFHEATQTDKVCYNYCVCGTILVQEVSLHGKEVMHLVV